MNAARAFVNSRNCKVSLRDALRSACRRPEADCIRDLVDGARLAPAEATEARALARSLAQALRERDPGRAREGLVQGLLQEFALSSQEGVALMCLAEALLRIPDSATRDALIRDKIGPGDWQAHLGQSQSPFVNAATWGLVVTGRLVATHTERGLANALSRLLARSGEPIVRRGVDLAMRLMGEQFVVGESIDEALRNAARREAQGFRHSYDMLGEAALTDDDALRYHAAYRGAIEAIGRASEGRGIYDGPGISIKLSALHPRYTRSQRERVMDELYPRLLALAVLARDQDIGVNIDAEEADRLELSLDLVEKLALEPALAGWNGIGFVVQAYQKRCTYVLDFLIDLAQRSRRRLMLRLVKGAYWDTEIKRAQVDGMPDYPVFTRKVHTDVSYLACARKLLGFPAEIYPQFATHNAYTLAAVHAMAGPSFYVGQYEFQCLHGMGEPLYEEVVAPKADGGLARPCRIYAPVGTHETLLAYLVRRLLENGANTSFVHRIADSTVALDELIADPVTGIERAASASGVPGAPHPRIPLPRDLFGSARPNSSGVDLSDEREIARLSEVMRGTRAWRAVPVVAGAERAYGEGVAVCDPADRRREVGRVVEALQEEVADALAAAAAGFARWQATPVATRASMLDDAADRIEAERQELIPLIVHEAGKTWANAVGELRESVDFLRYYAAEARAAEALQGLGVVICISPWNFPASIFVGQVAAALVAGNAVIAKPAEQTPLIAAELVRVLHAAGIPADALQFLPGRGETVGAALVADARVRGVLFTGSNEVARALARSLAGRFDATGRAPVLIAETGGQNAMIVDSSALAEQAVADAIASAFDSAGQRCSALRVLCLQEEIAERTLGMLRGAMRELAIGDPERFETDVGPVIDIEAKERLDAHVAAMRNAGHRVFQPVTKSEDASNGVFVPPTLIEIDRIGELEREVFGPILHVVRYRREELGELIDAINATGYGLTFGIESRIDETIDFAIARIRAGNMYVNRNMIGAVVGVQPFGGEGLSGTGPKAGGPLYLQRVGETRVLAPALVTTADDARTATDDARAAIDDARAAIDDARAARLERLRTWLRDAALAELCAVLVRQRPSLADIELVGPTGERNVYALKPRGVVLCAAEAIDDLAFQLAFVLAAGARALWPANDATLELARSLPPELAAEAITADPDVHDIDAALVQGSAEFRDRWSRRLAERDGALVAVQYAAGGTRAHDAYSVLRLMAERSVSINTAAAGGNATLMTID
ncbi:MAG TPA: trifunctional transcriptional regulator/proline dehydrogenase/L-glutamate gamma-semialdehyde dehydrogenase [Casimicrobiaceae bacterium]